MTPQHIKTRAAAKPGKTAKLGRKTAAPAPAATPVPAHPKALSPILAAAAELLDEQGFDGLSTTAVAHRAQVSTATIYRDYPDKLAILRALIVHVTLSRQDFLVKSFSRITDAPDWREPMAETLRKAYYLRMHAPGGGSTRRALQHSPELWLWDEKHSEQLAEECAKFIRKRNPSITPATAKRIMLAGIITTTALLDAACLMPVRSANLVVEECVTMMHLYFAPYLD